MDNNRIPLSPGTRLTDNLVIERLLSDIGGTSLTYVANRYSHEGKFEGKKVIKEFYPLKSAVQLVRNQNKVVALGENETLNKSVSDEIHNGFIAEHDAAAELFADGDSNSVFLFSPEDINEEVNKQPSFSGTYARYLAIATVKGLTLSEYLEINSDLSLEIALLLIKKILIPLKIMHSEKGMLHLDLKDDNIFLPDSFPDIRDTFCIILDCGSAKRIENIIPDKNFSCTERYAAPELRRLYKPGDATEYQLSKYRSKVTIATDLYAVGAIAFKLIMGKEWDVHYWDKIEFEDKQNNKSKYISDAINRRLGEEYPYMCHCISRFLIRLLYTMPSINSRVPDIVVRYSSCDELNDDISLALAILNNRGYHPEVLAQMSRNEFPNILVKNNIVKDSNYDIKKELFNPEWFPLVKPKDA